MLQAIYWFVQKRATDHSTPTAGMLDISYLIILGAFDAFCKVLEKRSSFIAKFSERHPLQERRNWDAFLKLVS